MGVSVQFVYSDWVAQFPAFSYLTEAQAQMWFDQATAYLRNDGTGPTNNAQLQTQLLYLITAHLAKLFNPTVTGEESANLGIVGRISSAGEGSVNVSAEYAAPQAASFWTQTQYGAAYWQLSAPLRLGPRWIPAPRFGQNADRPFDTFFGGGIGRGRFF